MAGSDYTRAVFSSLSSGEENFQAIYSQLRTTIDTLDSQLQTNLAEWEGSARSAYYAAKAKWDAAMADMQSVLMNLQRVASEASSSYPATEAANTQLWS
jgi:6 kDa early secretory antigenic target